MQNHKYDKKEIAYQKKKKKGQKRLLNVTNVILCRVVYLVVQVFYNFVALLNNFEASSIICYSLRSFSNYL